MCGLVCILSFNDKHEFPSLVERMTEVLDHRGPDARATWCNDNVALGHTRLSIIDLHEGANQPFVDETSGLIIVFNGEIYNYKEIRETLKQEGHIFNTESDTEVLLKAYLHWREKCVDKLIGMWSFVVFDEKKNSLFVCRDRFGIKPLYYVRTKNTIAFSSEIKPFLVGGLITAEVNKNTVFKYLTNNEVDTTNETFFSGVKQFPPGNYCLFDAGNNVGLKQEPQFNEYWSVHQFPDAKIKKVQPYPEQVRTFTDMFEQSIKLHLRSDVKLASCLSGGLDSSSIVAWSSKLLKNEGKKLSSFSAVFPGEDFDESKFVDIVVEHCGLDSNKIVISTEEFAKDIDKVILSQEEPFGSTGIFVQWKVFEKASSQNIKVVLDGQGSDEYLAGYYSFFIPYMYEEMKRFRFWNVALTLKIYFENNTNSHYLFSKLLPFIRKLQGKKNNGSSTWVSKELKKYVSEVRKNATPEPRQKMTVKNILKKYITTNSLPSLLRYEDKNSMYFSIESRVPFLDHRLVEYALSADYRSLLYRGITKRLLRDGVKGLVPEEILNRRDKLGFAKPEDEWLNKVIIPRLKKMITKDYVSEYVDLNAFNEALNKPENYKKNGPWLWRVYNLFKWHEFYILSK